MEWVGKIIQPVDRSNSYHWEGMFICEIFVVVNLMSTAYICTATVYCSLINKLASYSGEKFDSLHINP